MEEPIEDYEGEINLEDAGYLEDIEEEDNFEQEYDKIFETDKQVDKDLEPYYERDAITGRKAKKPKMSALNKSKLSKNEMDELFLE